MIYVCCYCWHNVTFLDLPIIEPTEYMYENYRKNEEKSDEKKENWMIYMEVTKLIMAECSGLKKSNSSFEEKLAYLSEIKGKKVKNT